MARRYGHIGEEVKRQAAAAANITPPAVVEPQLTRPAIDDPTIH
jgi:hypothetical protein